MATRAGRLYVTLLIKLQFLWMSPSQVDHRALLRTLASNPPPVKRFTGAAGLQMGKLFLSLMLNLVLVSVWCDELQPVHNEVDPRELLDLIRLVTHTERQMVVEEPPDELWPDTQSVEKRDLPRLGVSIYRPSRVKSSKSMDTPRYRISYPAEQMARIHG